MPRAALAAGALFFALATPALACRGADYTVGILYDEPPAHIGADTLVLDVAFPESETAGNVRSRRIVAAQVRRVVQGEFTGDSVRVLIGGHSCSSPFRFGTEGLIIGRIAQRADGEIFLPRGETMSVRRRRLATEAANSRESPTP